MRNAANQRLCVLASFAIVIAILLMPTCLAQDAAAIQADLDADGYCQLGPRVYVLESDVFVRSGQTLAGAGAASTLRFSRDGAAIRAAPASGSYYFANLRDFRVVNGGVIVGELSQTVTLSGIVVVNAPVDAFTIEGIGERIALRDCVAWEAGRHGFAVKTATTHNGILFDRCNAQNCWGVGVWLECAPGAEQTGTILRDCTVQANCRADWNGDGRVDVSDVAALATPNHAGLARVVARYGERLPADVTIRGYVQRARIESTWIESVRHGRSVGTCLVAEPVIGADGREWRPGWLWIGGASNFMLGSRAALLDRVYNAEISELSTSGVVEWSGVFAAAEPGGAKRTLLPTRFKRVFPASQPASAGGTP